MWMGQNVLYINSTETKVLNFIKPIPLFLGENCWMEIGGYLKGNISDSDIFPSTCANKLFFKPCELNFM